MAATPRALRNKSCTVNVTCPHCGHIGYRRTIAAATRLRVAHLADTHNPALAATTRRALVGTGQDW
ncbi:MAG: hypothetical protein ACTHXC_00340 [Brachybacterium sp.]